MRESAAMPLGSWDAGRCGHAHRACESPRQQDGERGEGTADGRMPPPQRRGRMMGARPRSGRFLALAATTFAAALFAADRTRDGRTDEGLLWSRIETLLATSVASAREGDLPAAWASQRRALELAGDSELLALRRAAYCRRAHCPSIHDLARLLGKPRSALDSLAGACPDMSDHRCKRWAATLREGAAYLGAEAEETPPAQVVEIELLFADEDDPRPWTVVEVGGEAMWAMVDTGGVRFNLPVSWVGRESIEFLPVGGFFHGVDTDGVVRRGRHGVLHGFRLGTFDLGRIAAMLNSGNVNTHFGMDVLLRYDALCFEWPREPTGIGRLHLGSLGPCRAAEAAENASLLPRTGQPLVEVALNDGTREHVLVDTGAISTDCKEGFLARYGEAPLRFGTHPALSAQTCSENPFPVHPAQHFAIAVGMDTLLQFAAFGWELEPFRMYFLPKSETTLAEPPADAP